MAYVNLSFNALLWKAPLMSRDRSQEVIINFWAIIYFFQFGMLGLSMVINRYIYWVSPNPIDLRA